MDAEASERMKKGMRKGVTGCTDGEVEDAEDSERMKKRLSGCGGE